MKEDNFGELFVECVDDEENIIPNHCAMCDEYLLWEEEKHCGILCFDFYNTL